MGEVVLIVLVINAVMLVVDLGLNCSDFDSGGDGWDENGDCNHGILKSQVVEAYIWFAWFCCILIVLVLPVVW